MKHLSDNELLIQISNKNKQALSQLYDRHASQLLGLIFKIVHQREIAEDILQDTFLTVWKKSHTFNASRGNAKAWLYSIARRKAIKYRK